VFVAAVSQLGAALARDPSGTVFARFAALFVVIFWAWILYTLYANRFDTDDLIFRLGKSGGMLAIAAIAINLPRLMAGHGGGIPFAACYVILRTFLIALYGRARYHLHGEARALSDTYIAGYSFTTGLWLVSIFLPSPFRYVLWGVAMVIDLAVPTRAWRTLTGASVVISHLTDRFGTFFIIVLGESVVAAVAGVAGFEFTVESWIIAGVGFIMTLCMWWIYFDLADTSVVGRGALGLIFVYAHFPSWPAWPRSAKAPRSPSSTERSRTWVPVPAGRWPAASRHSRFLWPSSTSGLNGPRFGTARSSRDSR
jgi:low temperature requirement protein LtrA